MSRFVSMAVLLAGAVFATAALAAPQGTPAPNPAASSTAAASANHSPIKPGDRNCLRDTGSLIPAKKDSCLPVAGRSYSQQDLQSTGKTNIGPALQQLDPSITVSGRGN